MHWSLRAAFSIAVGAFSWLPISTILAIKSGNRAPVLIAWLGFIFVPPTLCLALWEHLRKAEGPESFDRETRCRRCRYILRGIPEPRCPECGERI